MRWPSGCGQPSRLSLSPDRGPGANPALCWPLTVWQACLNWQMTLIQKRAHVINVCVGEFSQSKCANVITIQIKNQNTDSIQTPTPMPSLGIHSLSPWQTQSGILNTWAHFAYFWTLYKWGNNMIYCVSCIFMVYPCAASTIISIAILYLYCRTSCN